MYVLGNFDKNEKVPLRCIYTFYVILIGFYMILQLCCFNNFISIMFLEDRYDASRITCVAQNDFDFDPPLFSFL